MFLFSGKTIGDLGNYDLCTRETNMRYYVFYVRLQGQLGGVGVGLCLPAKCEVEVMQTLASKYMNPQLLKVGLYAEAAEPKAMLPTELDTGCIISIVLFSTLGLLSVVGAVV